MKKVFIVDDSMFIITQLKQILEKGGYEIIGHAVDGQQAIDSYSKIATQVDIVTLDITMPGLDGISALKEMRSINPETKFVIISAIGKKQTVLETRKLGADGYIIKPLSTDKVLKRFKDL